MKLAKMSLVAALLLGANAYAIDNVKVNGNAKLYYETVDSDAAGAPDMFDKDASGADIALQLGVTADLSEGISAGATFNAVSTLGLENNLVSGVWSGAHGASDGGSSFNPAKGVHPDLKSNVDVDDASWFSEAWIAGTAGKTTAKVGRQALDTPLAFTETWSITDNTFEAAVLMNQDIPDTTLIAAWIGKSNGIADDRGTNTITVTDPQDALGGGTAPFSYNAGNIGYVTAVDGKFSTFAKNGAYALGAINNSFEPLTAKAWYYEVPSLAQAYWLQADLDMEGILAGVQYVDIDTDKNFGANTDNDTAYGAMLGYAMKDVVTVKAAFSSVDDEGAIGVANLATGTGNGGQTQLYTEMWWWYGTVSATGADTFSISAETTVGEGYDLYLGYWNSDVDAKGAADNREVNEIAFTVSKSYGPLDTSVALLWDEIDYTDAASTDEEYTTLQIYLTYNF